MRFLRRQKVILWVTVAWSESTETTWDAQHSASDRILVESACTGSLPTIKKKHEQHDIVYFYGNVPNS